MKKDTSLKSRIEKLHIILKIGLIIFLIEVILFYIFVGLIARGVISEGNFVFLTVSALIPLAIILIIIGIVLTILERKEPQKKKFVKPNKMKWKTAILIFLISVLWGGFLTWFIFRNEGYEGKMGSFILIPFLGSIILTLILTLILNESPWKIALFIPPGVLIAFFCEEYFYGAAGANGGLGRMMMFFITIPSAFIGSYLAQLIKYIKSKSIASVKN